MSPVRHGYLGDAAEAPAPRAGPALRLHRPAGAVAARQPAVQLRLAVHDPRPGRRPGGSTRTAGTVGPRHQTRRGAQPEHGTAAAAPQHGAAATAVSWRAV